MSLLVSSSGPRDAADNRLQGCNESFGPRAVPSKVNDKPEPYPVENGLSKFKPLSKQSRTENGPAVIDGNMSATVHEPGRPS